jgi:monoamine oxidase
VSTQSGQEIEAERVIVTVPLGVLQSGRIAFDPPITSLNRAINLLAMGAVLRLALLFDEPFWEERKEIAGGKDLHDLSFVHATEEAIPVWWTAYPVRAPLLVGWAGGVKSTRIADRTTDGLTRIGIDILARVFAMNARTLAGKLVAAWTHDWQNDPWSRGAYSYPVVGGAEASQLLARSVSGTVFFAGEAASAEDRNGTVDGAIASGQEAARRILRKL